MASGERPECLDGIVPVDRFAEHVVVTHDHRVSCQHDVSSSDRVGLRLPRRESKHHLLRALPRLAFLDDVGGPDGIPISGSGQQQGTAR